MSDLLRMLQAATATPTKPQATKKRKIINVNSAGPNSQRKKSDERYRALLQGAELTTTEIANTFGHTLSGTMCSLRKLEDRGLVERVGVAERDPEVPRGRGPLIWTWAYLPT